ncbi:sushi, nidogen and EGF-like domain-containing protein 1 [Haliotis rufescens]|uniref:sushi, nidogen and EGF-like domain-containing protein 1 n=1 Tax=Haliotis rufescens TaxID=6454 RepID=UPI00201F3BFB|nr:sushi, nidogen and EGF-like domain-containing protein 1 [Haliotis rufescens]
MVPVMFRFLAVCLMAPLVSSQRASTWDECQCEWATWNPWSICDSQCYGMQQRSRSVSMIDSCVAFESCDAGAGAYEHQDCNTVCTFGSYDSSSGRCKCPGGRYGPCCTDAITCGAPQTIANGDYSVSNSYNYGSLATYTCNHGYNMTGTATRTCSQDIIISTVGFWTGMKPDCLFAESCNSSPCQNEGTCVNGLEMYTCVCSPGWSGINCETDVQPPVVSGCENKTALNTADRELTHEWTVPTFTDPLGNEVTTTSNYVSSSYRFPWGDFFVQYVATKTNNGLQTECKFQLNVRPYPCDELPVPKFGYVACNGWRTDFGQYCLIGCRANYTLPRDINEDRWYVCGASGAWSSNPGTFQCEDATDLQSISGGILGSPDTCDDVTSVQALYIEELQKSNYNSVCTKHNDLCLTENVSVRCQ